MPNTDGRTHGLAGEPLRFRPGDMPPMFGDTRAILIVDDDEQLARVLNRLLSRAGYQCEVASDAAQARAHLAEHPFAVALIDVMMPGETGLELAAALSREQQDLAVVMVTAVDSPSIAELALDSGVYGYIVKPFRPNQVLITVANAGRLRCLEIERRRHRERLEERLHASHGPDTTPPPLAAIAEPDDTDVKAQTEREQLLAQLHQSQRLESLGQLAGGVAHDFNNLLAVILNYSAFVREAIDAADGDTERWAAVQDDVNQIERAAQRGTELTHQLLAFGRREVVQPRVLNVNDVVLDVEQLLRRSIGEHVRLVTTLSDDLWSVMADAGQLEQVLVNLAVNARDAMPAGGVLMIGTSNVYADEDFVAVRPGLVVGPCVRLQVSDTGTGMSKDILSHVFEPFFTTKPRGEGSGLGLATVYGIVTQAGGYAGIYSEPGLGTTFTAILPAIENGNTVTEAAAAHHSGSETILVVEDEPAIREVTRRVLSATGHTVLVADGGEDAVEIASTYPEEIHLLLTDVVMPKMLGREVAERVRAIRPHVRVLYMSGYAQPVLASQGTLTEGVTLLEKPFSRQALLSKVREVLDA